jgi:hypothetical protein
MGGDAIFRPPKRSAFPQKRLRLHVCLQLLDSLGRCRSFVCHGVGRREIVASSHHLGEPKLDGLGFGAGDGLDQAQQGFSGGDVSEVVFAVCSRQFQSVTSCHRLTALFGKPPPELVPVFARCLVVGLLSQHLHHVDHRKSPDFRGLVVHAAYGLAVEFGRQYFHAVLLNHRQKPGRNWIFRARRPRPPWALQGSLYTENSVEIPARHLFRARQMAARMGPGVLTRQASLQGSIGSSLPFSGF